jgi:phosphoribosylglycinamide formyltransferase-1
VGAAGLDRARAAGIEAIVLDHRGYASRDDYDRALAKALHARHVSLVCLAGFMRLVGAPLLDAFPNAILNVQPVAAAGVSRRRRATAGARTRRSDHRRDGAPRHGEELDGGPIVMQSAVPVRDDDTVDMLSARILIEEHRIYPEAVQILLDGRWRVEGRRFRLSTRERAAE